MFTETAKWLFGIVGSELVGNKASEAQLSQGNCGCHGPGDCWPIGSSGCALALRSLLFAMIVAVLVRCC